MNKPIAYIIIGWAVGLVVIMWLTGHKQKDWFAKDEKEIYTYYVIGDKRILVKSKEETELVGGNYMNSLRFKDGDTVTYVFAFRSYILDSEFPKPEPQHMPVAPYYNSFGMNEDSTVYIYERGISVDSFSSKYQSNKNQ